METFVIILEIVWAILCLVLFFKMWGMCNDVSKIRKHFNQDVDFDSVFNFLIRTGEKEKAKDLLFDRILSNMTIFDKDLLINSETRIQKAAKLYENELHYCFDIKTKMFHKVHM